MPGPLAMQGLAGAEGSGSLLDPLVVLMQHGDSAIGPAIGAFSLLAIATSFIGTTLGAHSRRGRLWGSGL